jgi:hypothetical protein
MWQPGAQAMKGTNVRGPCDRHSLRSEFNATKSVVNRTKCVVNRPKCAQNSTSEIFATLFPVIGCLNFSLRILSQIVQFRKTTKLPPVKRPCVRQVPRARTLAPGWCAGCPVFAAARLRLAKVSSVRGGPTSGLRRDARWVAGLGWRWRRPFCLPCRIDWQYPYRFTYRGDSPLGFVHLQ